MGQRMWCRRGCGRPAMVGGPCCQVGAGGQADMQAGRQVASGGSGGALPAAPAMLADWWLPPSLLALCAGYLGAGPHRGGGMHVGPGDPIFCPGRMGGGVGGPPGHGSLPPGARWDPVAPPGMPGFHPGGGSLTTQGGHARVWTAVQRCAVQTCCAAGMTFTCWFCLALPCCRRLPASAWGAAAAAAASAP